MRRTERLKALDWAVRPDERVTREIGAKRSLKLWPLVCVIEEAQNLFAHPEHGKAAGLDAELHHQDRARVRRRPGHRHTARRISPPSSPAIADGP